MPTWGWFIVALVVVDALVLVAWLLTRKKPKSPGTATGSVSTVGLDTVGLGTVGLDAVGLDAVGLDDAARADIHQLLAANKNVQAIKLFRDRTGAGLLDSEKVIESVRRGHPLPTGSTVVDAARAASQPWDHLIPELQSLKSEGKAITAIKLLRDRTGLSLRDAKNAVDHL